MRVVSRNSWPGGSVQAAVAAGLFLALASGRSVEAIVLTFEPTTKNFQPTDQAYGDRVTAASQNGFEYGPAWGFTPNITVAYGPGSVAEPCQWTVGYADLVGVLFENNDGWGILEITLSADLGTLVELIHFDMAAYSQVGPIRNLRVSNAAGDVLFEESDLLVPHVGHASFPFDPPLVGRALTIRFDSGNLASRSDDIGIDNITFRQAASPTASSPETWSRIKSLYR